MIVLATRNRHKVGEIAAMAAGRGLEFSCLGDHRELPEVVEDQPTLEGNARKKACEAALALRRWSLAEDTGLQVDALGGEPGVMSARYAGPACDFAANNRKLLAALEGVEPRRRRAVFRTVMALCSPDGEVVLEDGVLEGSIGLAPRGTGGFGYDPVFLVGDTGRTLAELSSEEKNGLSHRRRAFEKMLPHLRRLVGAP